MSTEKLGKWSTPKRVRIRPKHSAPSLSRDRRIKMHQSINHQSRPFSNFWTEKRFHHEIPPRVLPFLAKPLDTLFRRQTLSRPRTELLDAKDEGYSADVFSKNKKRSSLKIFANLPKQTAGDLKKKRSSLIIWQFFRNICGKSKIVFRKFSGVLQGETTLLMPWLIFNRSKNSTVLEPRTRHF